jgi:transcriptional regulator with XRE-family HTH domain
MLTNRLRELRDEFGVTTNTIAKESGLPLDTVRQLTYRSTHIPSTNSMKALASYFGLESPLHLLVWIDQSPPPQS